MKESILYKMMFQKFIKHFKLGQKYLKNKKNQQAGREETVWLFEK